MTITVTNGQTIYDLAIRYYGTWQAYAYLLADNSWLNLDTTLSPGDELEVREVYTEVVTGAKQIAAYFEIEDLIPNSGINEGTADNNGYVVADYVDINYITNGS